MAQRDPLVLTFDPQTVDHLGAKMYSHLPNALAELVANAFDADAKNVMISIEDGAVSIVDDGHGMSRADVANKYLHIGRNRRAEEQSGLTEGGKRSVSGKKGLGKLALFGIGKRVALSTTRAGSEDQTRIVLSYSEMMSAKGVYAPAEDHALVEKKLHGTRVRLSELKRSSAIDAEELAGSLSRLFNYIDKSFSVVVRDIDGREFPVTNERRLASIEVEFRWAFPESWTTSDQFGADREIRGLILSSRTPLRHGMRGITLYVNGRLANEPEFFGASESSFAFSYLTGYLDVDFLDGLEPDVIATDRRAIDWDTDVTGDLRIQLQSLMVRLGQEWRQRRNALRAQQRDDRLGIDSDEWVGSIRAAEREPVRELVSVIASNDIDMTPDQQGDLLELVMKVAPPNAEFVWRHLHPEIRDATRNYYIAGDYYAAIQEAIKRYVGATKSRSGVEDSEPMKIVSKAFGDNGRIRVFQKYMAAQAFDPQTQENIERGQMHASMGIVAGFRNPMAHEEVERLHNAGAFTFQDCLDALSIVSHLMRRLDDAVDAP